MPSTSGGAEFDKFFVIFGIGTKGMKMECAEVKHCGPLDQRNDLQVARAAVFSPEMVHLWPLDQWPRFVFARAALAGECPPQNARQ